MLLVLSVKCNRTRVYWPSSSTQYFLLTLFLSFVARRVKGQLDVSVLCYCCLLGINSNTYIKPATTVNGDSVYSL